MPETITAAFLMSRSCYRRRCLPETSFKFIRSLDELFRRTPGTLEIASFDGTKRNWFDNEEDEEIEEAEVGSRSLSMWQRIKRRRI